MKKTTFDACGKFILLGEHFVVYDVPALAFPLTDVRTSVTVCPASKTRLFVHESTTESARRMAKALIQSAIEALDIDSTRGWDVTIDSQIPIGMGLGSSAAFSVALVGALSRAASLELDGAALNAAAHALEGIVHGAPSGIDNTVVTYVRPVRFQRDSGFTFPVLGGTFTFLLASSGQVGSTYEAVANVRLLQERDPEGFLERCRAATSLVECGERALADGEHRELGRQMSANHELLRGLEVSNPMLDRLVATALESGAFGAKLTGAGLGGFVVALVDESRRVAVEAALYAAGSERVFSSRASGDA